MRPIERQDISEAFARCWQAAGRHLEAQVQGPFHGWLKASLTPPFLEHLSFRLGNQLFFVRIEDADGALAVPGSRAGLRVVAERCRGHACLMPMRRRANAWAPQTPGWGLIDERTGASVDPVALVSDERIEMTDWELHNFAVQVVWQHLERTGRQRMSRQADPDVEPAIWFVGDSGPEWIVVRAVRYPAPKARPPSGWRQIAERCAARGSVGHFASVSVAAADDAFDPTGAVPATPLWRGHAMVVSFDGLEPGPSQPA